MLVQSQLKILDYNRVLKDLNGYTSDEFLAEVEKRLAGSTPKGNGSAPAEITMETAKKMSMAELDELARTQPELFNKLFN